MDIIEISSEKKEGIAVSVPIYYATGDRRKAFLYSFLSGLSEPVGALVAGIIGKHYENLTYTCLKIASLSDYRACIS